MIETRSEFQLAVRQAFADIASAGPREIWMCDEDFSDWPLNDPQVIEQLSRWAMGHRTCTVLALNYETIQRNHPRWVQWRRERSHVVRCLIPDETDGARLPCVLLAPGTLTLRLVDRVRCRGSVSAELADAVREREHLDALLQRSVDAFPASMLGL
ncbi:MAG: hypothetical protein QFE16_11700 [Pseudomonadota bacterium]|nr:hypothetical protein [Pseudomonadota bacterium]